MKGLSHAIQCGQRLGTRTSEPGFSTNSHCRGSLVRFKCDRHAFHGSDPHLTR
jgi:hypothetical protein